MPLYTFTALDGREYEEYADMVNAPPFGSTRIIEGVEYTRFPERANSVFRDYRCVSVRWPKRHQWKDSTGKGHPGKKFDAKNNMVCESRSDVMDFEAKCAERGVQTGGWNT